MVVSKKQAAREYVVSYVLIPQFFTIRMSSFFTYLSFPIFLFFPSGWCVFFFFVFSNCEIFLGATKATKSTNKCLKNAAGSTFCRLSSLSSDLILLNHECWRCDAWSHLNGEGYKGQKEVRSFRLSPMQTFTVFTLRCIKISWFSFNFAVRTVQEQKTKSIHPYSWWWF